MPIDHSQTLVSTPCRPELIEQRRWELEQWLWRLTESPLVRSRGEGAGQGRRCREGAGMTAGRARQSGPPVARQPTFR